jgi:hypothetical protein
MSKNEIKLVGDKQAASQDELRIAHSGAALLANKFYVSVGNSGVRIAFAEAYSPEEEPLFRSAVILPIMDAVGLYKLLQEVVAPSEAFIGQAILEAQKKKEEEEKKNG